MEYKQPGKETAARTFMTELRNGLPTTPIALCSYRFPSLHMQFPWKAFLEKCDYNMPQVYWQEAHNPDVQITRCVNEFKAIAPYRTITPTGPLYPANGWSATAAELVLFMDTCKKLNLPAVNYFTWDYRKTLPTQWNAIAAYKWVPDVVIKDLPEQYINALNTHNPATCASLYGSNAIRITASQTILGNSAIQNWFNTFFTVSLPNAVYKLTGVTGTGSSRRFTWTATSTSGKINNGSDTIGIVNGKIGYHYSFYTITS